MPVYSLNNPYYLQIDLKSLIERLGEMYTSNINDGKLEVRSTIKDESNIHWAKQEHDDYFNLLVPKFKSLHLDMYSFIENVSKTINNNFPINEYEVRYRCFREFRILNNKYKHYTVQTEIKLIKIADINTKTLDLLCTFDFDSGSTIVLYSHFVQMFLEILKDLRLITISSN